MLSSPEAFKALASIEMITPKIMIATLNENPQTTVISCYSPTNVSDESYVVSSYKEWTAAVTRHVPRHNVLVVGGDFNAHLDRTS